MRFRKPANALINVVFTLLSRLYAMLVYRGIPMDAVARRKIWVVSAHPTVWVTPEEYAFNLSRMIDLTRAMGARPILLDAPPAPLSPEIRNNVGFIVGSGYQTPEQLLAAHARYQAITARVARERDVPFVRTAMSPEEAPAYFTLYDLPHPNAAGQARIARFLHAEILSEIAASRTR